MFLGSLVRDGFKRGFPLPELRLQLHEAVKAGWREDVGEHPENCQCPRWGLRCGHRLRPITYGPFWHLLQSLWIYLLWSLWNGVLDLGPFRLKCFQKSVTVGWLFKIWTTLQLVIQWMPSRVWNTWELISGLPDMRILAVFIDSRIGQTINSWFCLMKKT